MNHQNESVLSAISTQLVSFKELFSDHYYVIPDYQRGYSWEEKHLRDLIKDIESLYTKEHKHYTGTIVASSTTDDKEYFEIVDGQQRITSLVILLKCIYNRNNQKYKSILNRYVKRGEFGNSRMVLTPNEESRDFFEKCIVENENSDRMEVKSHENIKKAKTIFSRWLEKESSAVDNILNVIENKLGFIFFTPKDNKTIGIMFEVINNRGKRLSELEKIKNYLIYFSTVMELPDLKEVVKTEWVKIQKYLSKAKKTNNEEENRFLRYAFIVYFNPSKEKSWNVYDELKLKFSVHESDSKSKEFVFKKIKGFVKFLSSSALHYAYFYNGDFFNSDYQKNSKANVGGSLKKLRCQPVNASIMPLYFAIMSRSTSSIELVKVLDMIEIVNFRVYILPKITNRADSKQAELFSLANSFFNDSAWNNENNIDEIQSTQNPIICETFIERLREFTIEMCNIEDFVRALTLDFDEKDDFFHWNGLRYFLARYEEELQIESNANWDIEKILISRNDKNSLSNDYLSREHLWARKNKSSHFQPDYYEKRRLGNFVLIGLGDNSGLDSKDIPDKIKKLNDDKVKNNSALGLVQIRELKEILGNAIEFCKNKGHIKKFKNYYKDLSTYINDERETKLLKFALERWKLPGENLDQFEKIDTFQATKDKSNINYYPNDYH